MKAIGRFTNDIHGLLICHFMVSGKAISPGGHSAHDCGWCWEPALV